MNARQATISSEKVPSDKENSASTTRKCSIARTLTKEAARVKRAYP